MAEMTFKVSLEEFGKRAAEYALDEITYNDLTIRQWADKIASGEFQLVRHGRWIEKERYNLHGDEYCDCLCSECCHRISRPYGFYPDYCEDCGARMVGDEDAAD